MRRTSALAASVHARACASTGAQTRISQREAIAPNSMPNSRSAATQARGRLRRAAKVRRNFSTFGATTNMQ